jgi:LPXTG-motif cell wall-anchored protein
MTASATVRTFRAALAAGVACLIGGMTILVAALLPSATAQELPPFEDFFEANAKTCEDAGLEGDILSAEQVEGTVSGDDNQFLNVEVLDADVVITGTVVKGANAYRVYYGDPVPDMTAPLKKGKYPAISHWYVCGFEQDESPTTPTDEPTKPTDEPTKPTDEPTKPTDEPTKPTDEPTKPTDEPTTPAKPELPVTGGDSGNGWLAAAGAALLAAGSGLVLVGRRAGRHEA